MRFNQESTRTTRDFGDEVLYRRGDALRIRSQSLVSRQQITSSRNQGDVT